MIITKDKTIKNFLQIAFFFMAAQMVFWLFFWRRLPLQLPLFYSLPWGEKQLASPTALSVLPGLSILVTFTNVFLASTLAREEKLICQLLAIFATIFNFLSLVTLVKIVFLIT